MAARRATRRPARRSTARTRPGHIGPGPAARRACSSGRSIGLRLRRQRPGAAADPRASRLLRHGRRVLPVRLGDRRHPVRRAGSPQRLTKLDRPTRRARGSPSSTTRAASSTPTRPISTLAGSSARRHAHGRAAVHRRAGGLGGDLPAGPGGARAAHRSGGDPRSPPLTERAPGIRLVPGARAARCRARRPAGGACGPSPTSPTSASGRRTSSRSCSTRSTISTTRRRASSPSIPTAAIVYLNATLASWLDYDLAQVGSGGLDARPTWCRATSSR